MRRRITKLEGFIKLRCRVTGFLLKKRVTNFKEEKE